MSKAGYYPQLIAELDSYRETLMQSGFQWPGEVVSHDLGLIIWPYREVS